MAFRRGGDISSQIVSDVLRGLVENSTEITPNGFITADSFSGHILGSHARCLPKGGHGM